MRLTTPPLTIDQQDSFKNDALDREQFGHSLLNLITRTKEELVICLDAPWGEGKTSFVQMWQGLLAKNQIRSIYFDAFSNDYIDDAFIAMVSEIVSLVENRFKEDSPAKKRLDEFKKKASNIGMQLLSWATKLGVKAATLGVIKDSDIEALIAIKDDLAKGTSGLISNFIEDRISAHNHEVQTAKSFRETLEKLAMDISENSGNPLIIIIDELDRCKPTYAIEVIEIIKHLFSVKNIVFMLVMHKQQLEEAIKCIYGQNIDATSYLQKFINIDCKLPKNREPDRLNDYKKYCTRLYDLHELNTWGDAADLLDCVAILARQFDLSLRQLEKCFTNISIFYATVSERYYRLTPVIAFLSIIKVLKPSLYVGLGKGNISYKTFLEKLNLQEPEIRDSDTRGLSFILFWMKFCLYSDEEAKSSEDLEEFKRVGGELSIRYNLKRDKIIPLYCDLLDIVQLN
jgi:hypothetical protein